MSRPADGAPLPAGKADDSVPRLHAVAAATNAVEDAQLVANFHQLDDYGRRVALAMMCSLARLAAARSGVAGS